ncbi:MAG: LacI family DNA-binding transcriptional regulator [Chitinophagaceae bacterium]|nr:LacI family DNA-binding transcriptional regulator [Chitinophagaceae bacterium]
MLLQKPDKRVTIHDIARATGLAPSSVSKALNDLPSVSKRIKALVKAKAEEMNYRHNSSAANLRRGSSRTIGVIVPKINVAFFADVIAGMEEVCFENDYRLIICQSHEELDKEIQAVETFIEQNVDCILISLSQQTRSAEHLKQALAHHIQVVQFDRVDHHFGGHVIVNDNKAAAYEAVKHLADQGYRRIAFLGGAMHLQIYRDRKEGYLQAVNEADLDIPYQYIVDDSRNAEIAMEKATTLLKYRNPPDAFFTVTDHAALGVLKATSALKIKVPQQVGIVGFANETFTAVTSPTLSTIDQQSKMLGRHAADLYFNHILKKKPAGNPAQPVCEVIQSRLVVRESSLRNL